MPAFSVVVLLLMFVGKLLPASFLMVDSLGSPGVGVSIGTIVLETDLVGCGNMELDVVSTTSTSETKRGIDHKVFNTVLCIASSRSYLHLPGGGENLLLADRAVRVEQSFG